jgi:DNA-binding GntR family transcriptional regulator
MAASGLVTHGATGIRIAATLRNAILDGEYVPGERIRQDELAEQHGASRVPVRDALRILEAEGLITLVANAGAWVSRINLADCQEMYQMRERLEPLLLGFNIPLLTDQHVARLADLADAMETTTEVEGFLRMDSEFHLSCLQAAETTVLGDSVRSLWNRTQHYRRAATRIFYSDGDRSVHHDHQLLVEAISRRDVEEAERVLASHIRRSRLRLARHPEVFDDDLQRR